MNTLSKNWRFGAIGVCAAVAGLALLVAVAASGDAIGRSVAVLVGGGFAFGVLGCGLKEALATRSGRYFASTRAASPSYAPAMAGIVPMPRFVDATASEFDEYRRPAFAPVTSLTEAQVERQRAERQREERRAAQTRA